MNYLEFLSTSTETNPFPSSDELYNHLIYIHNCLSSHKIKHWIMYGTLLGAYRDSNIIPYDYDFDIGVLYEDVDIILSLNSEIEKEKYSIIKAYGTVYDISNIKSIEKKWKVSLKILFNQNPIADIYVYYLCEDKYIRRFDPIEKIYFWPNTTLPYLFIQTLTEIRIRDRLFPCPILQNILVEYWYGPMWKTPIKAHSQNGMNHEDYDYYGNYKYLNNKDLLLKIKEYSGIEVEIEKSECKNFHVNWIFPLDQIEWSIENEGLEVSKKVYKSIIQKKII